MWLGAMLLVAWAAPAEGQTCTYSVTPLSFGTAVGLPTPQMNATATISVTCRSNAVVAVRVCLSLPAGSAGLSINDRRLANGSNLLRYQLFSDPARTAVWGQASQAVAVDFRSLSTSPTTRTVTVYGRVLGGQTGLGFGTYQSTLVRVARRANYLATPPSCASMTGSGTQLSPLNVTATLQPSCTVAANPLNFGQVTSVQSAINASTNLSLNCSPGAPYTIALDGGSVSGSPSTRAMRQVAGSATIGYQLYRDATRTQIWGNTTNSVLRGTGTGNPVSIPIHGTVPAQGARPPGTYQDVVTVTVTY